MEWERARDNDDGATTIISELAELLSYLRRNVDLHDYSNTEDMAFSTYAREDVSKAFGILHNLAKGHALSRGRNHITLEDVPIVVKTVLSTAQIDRVRVFDLLLAHKGKLNSRLIVESLNMSKPSANKTMVEFKAIGLVDVGVSEDRADNNRVYREITLRPEFNWFLSDEFSKLREGFIPTDYRDFMTKDTIRDSTSKENGTHITHNIEIEDGNGQAGKEQLFWHIFQSLAVAERNDPSNYRETEKDTVNGTKLIQELIQTGAFYNGDAQDMIKAMVDTGKLEMVMMDTYRRKV